MLHKKYSVISFIFKVSREKYNIKSKKVKFCKFVLYLWPIYNREFQKSKISGNFIAPSCEDFLCSFYEISFICFFKIKKIIFGEIFQI